MKAGDEEAYRFVLAEAEQDMDPERWRSFADNAQSVVENAAKVVLAWLGSVPETHDPAQQVATVLRAQALPEAVEESLRRMLPNLLALGSTEHLLTDYDEARYTLPWELLTRESAEQARKAARRLVELAHRAIGELDQP